ncbi:hypothetical protein ACJMK2_036229 [Sinanodonta woodiana]|uniref:Uncharacterized protein n=1 Tax=Sinanodonta woodiana TaxID=1069815 RepID=A0ABD3WKN8_SINWO
MMVTQMKIFRKLKPAICFILVSFVFVVLLIYHDLVVKRVFPAATSVNYWNVRLPGILNWFSGPNMQENLNLHDLELYLRMYNRDFKKYYNYLIPSMRYFWPGNVSIVIVLDAENAEDRKLGQILTNKYPYPRVEYQDPIDSRIYHGKGHERMQRDFFYPETKVNKTYVGFLDTDTVFVTRVTPDLLFEDGKPIIIANYGEPGSSFWNRASRTTAKIYKAKEIMRCMSYFPVIIKVEHVVEVRKYLEKLHRKPFDEVFRQFSGNGISQFNIICQYLWNFHRDEYKFYFHVISSTPGKWDGKGSVPERESVEFYKTNFTAAQKVPKTRASIHYRYHPKWEDFNTYRNIVKKGICYSGGFNICPEKCKDFNRTVLQKELFYFEFNDWSWDPRCVDEQKKHYAKVDELRDSESEKALTKGCAEVDKITLK